MFLIDKGAGILGTMNMNNRRKRITNEDLFQKIEGIAINLNEKIDTINVNLSNKIDNFGGKIEILDETVNLLVISTAKGFADVDRRFDEVDIRFDKVENRLDRVEFRLYTVEKQVGRTGDQLDTLDGKVTSIETIQNRRLDTLEDKMHVVYAE